MSQRTEQSGLAVAHLEGLKRQFDTFALKYPDLTHVYVEHPPDTRPPIPFPSLGHVTGLFETQAAYESAHSVFLDGRWVILGLSKPRFYRNWAGWYDGEGISQFEALALNTDSLLSMFPIRVPVPCEVMELISLFPHLPPNPIVLPCGPQRWARILHWLAWSGLVMPGSRLSWNGIDRLPGEHSLDPRLTLSSIIDNLFLRSSLAAEWMIGKLELGIPEMQFQDMKTRPKKAGGRPSDTDKKKDRRIADAWRSSLYATYEELANKLNMTRRDVELAIDRERKRQVQRRKQSSQER